MRKQKEDGSHTLQKNKWQRVTEGHHLASRPHSAEDSVKQRAAPERAREAPEALGAPPPATQGLPTTLTLTNLAHPLCGFQ